MAEQAAAIDANTFAFFTRNPRGGSAKELNSDDIKRFHELADEKGFGRIVAHAPYTMNCCASDKKIRQFAHDTLADDLRRMEAVPGNYYNFHPGCHVGQGIDQGIDLIAEQLNSVLTGDETTAVLLETMAGKGSEIGSRFEELRRIIDLTEHDNVLGVCLDTCHVWDGGYDIVSDLDGVLEEFDKVIGLDRLKAIHLNDSMNPLGAHKDRHAKIGEGHIGAEALVRVMLHPALRGLPMILETPNDIDGYAREIAFLREKYSE